MDDCARQRTRAGDGDRTRMTSLEVRHSRTTTDVGGPSWLVSVGTPTTADTAGRRRMCHRCAMSRGDRRPLHAPSCHSAHAVLRGAAGLVGHTWLMPSVRPSHSFRSWNDGHLELALSGDADPMASDAAWLDVRPRQGGMAFVRRAVDRGTNRHGARSVRSPVGMPVQQHGRHVILQKTAVMVEHCMRQPPRHLGRREIRGR